MIVKTYIKTGGTSKNTTTMIIVEGCSVFSGYSSPVTKQQKTTENNTNQQ